MYHFTLYGCCKFGSIWWPIIKTNQILMYPVLTYIASQVFGTPKKPWETAQNFIYTVCTKQEFIFTHVYQFFY